MITIEQLKTEINQYKEHYPRYRDGQAVFNYIDSKYGVARELQFIHNIDCFYNDSCINEFIEKAVELINKQ